MENDCEICQNAVGKIGNLVLSFFSISQYRYSFITFIVKYQLPFSIILVGSVCTKAKMELDVKVLG